MFGNRSRQSPPRRQPDPLSGPGVYILILGGVMFILPTYFHESWLLTSWLGSMEAPVGLSLMVVGAALAVAGFVRGGVRKTGPEPAATDPTVVPPPPGPIAAEIGSATAPATPQGPGIVASPAYPAAAPGLGIDAPPPPLEPLYRPPTSLDDLGPSGPA